jgi:hypothetical protein
MTNEAPVRLVTGHRGSRYGEVLAVFAEGDRFSAHVYGTQLLNDCPQELWESLDGPSIARELGALMVKLNGPRYWMIDGLGSKGQPIEPVLHDFNGILMRRIAVVDLGTNPAQVPYTVRHVDRKAIFFFDEGSTVHELVDPDGLTYVMQAYCVGVDPALTESGLAGLRWAGPFAAGSSRTNSSSTPPRRWRQCFRTSSRTPTPCRGELKGTRRSSC